MQRIGRRWTTAAAAVLVAHAVSAGWAAGAAKPAEAPAVLLPRDGGLVKNAASPHARLRSADLGAVRWTGGFWADRFRRCAEATLPHLWDLLADPEAGHALTNFRIAAGLEQGEFAGTHWQDEWVYKWLEAATVVWQATRDPALERRIDETIDLVARAQQPDGYIATQITVRGWKRWQSISHHELYVMGHLITAGCLHHRITGKDALLAVGRRAADSIWETFKGGDPALAPFPFNPTIMMAGVELYRATGDKKYLDMANLFIDKRGAVPVRIAGREDRSTARAGYGNSDQIQNGVPLREETQAVGHMVLGTYFWAGAADAYMETGDATLLAALERLWTDLTTRRMYVTGGICSLHRGLSFRPGQSVYRANDVHEAAGDAYVLRGDSAYNETCAQIGSLMWNWRMLLISADPRYADLMERQLYNSILSGIDLGGVNWFYSNPLRRHAGEHQPAALTKRIDARFKPGRSDVCCPTNLLRTVAEWHGYLYSTSPDGLWVHHYGASAFDGALADGTSVRVTQATDYPWSGEIVLKVEPARPTAMTLRLRVPGWAEGARLEVNGRDAGVAAAPGTYAALQRTWQAGDAVRLVLPMEPRLVEANPLVEEARNQAAVMRGPLVYCLESPDLPEGVRVDEVYLPRDVRLSGRHDPALLGGVTVLEGEARRRPVGDWAGTLYRPLKAAPAQAVPVRLIPYYAWSNRGLSHMTVWLPLD